MILEHSAELLSDAVLTLVIDTSSAAVGAALGEVGAQGVELLASRCTVDARAHAELLVPSIRACLAEAGRTVSELGAVVAGLGPGPFTGLRVGLVTAAAIADARGIPTYGVCSLDAIAVGLTVDGELLVAGDARRKEIYWARYVGGTRTEGPAVGRPADVDPGAAVATAGAGARLYAGVLGRPLLERDHPDPVGLLRLAADRVRSGAPGEALTPLYLRRPDAVAPTDYKAVTPV